MRRLLSTWAYKSMKLSSSESSSSLEEKQSSDLMLAIFAYKVVTLVMWIESDEHCYVSGLRATSTAITYSLVPNFQPGAASVSEACKSVRCATINNNCNNLFNNLQIDRCPFYGVQFCGDGCVSALSLGLLCHNF